MALLGTMIIERRKVFFLLEVEILLWEGLIVIKDALIFRFALDFASIAFLPKGKIEIVAVIADPVALSSCEMSLGVVLHGGEVVFKGSQILAHELFFFFLI